jgi:hypothetical protein
MSWFTNCATLLKLLVMQVLLTKVELNGRAVTSRFRIRDESTTSYWMPRLETAKASYVNCLRCSVAALRGARHPSGFRISTSPLPQRSCHDATGATATALLWDCWSVLSSKYTDASAVVISTAQIGGRQTDRLGPSQGRLHGRAGGGGGSRAGH